ncbi:PilZ domain-containing protein [Peribacillus frigoritolerans]|uniref:PilZ domain-containing protein n=1 Tax=Peribacillus frigoritolerans TaxID=450367 RepID=UPI00301A5755
MFKIGDIFMGILPFTFPSTSDSNTIQRRQFVRLDVTLDTAIHPEHSEFTPFCALTEDISAGGASIRLLKGTAIQSVSQLYLWMALTMKSGEIHYLRLKSKVIRVTEKEHGNICCCTSNFLNLQKMIYRH